MQSITCGDIEKKFESGFTDIGILDLVTQSPALSPYDVQQVVGQGSYSTVYVAVEREGNRKVAIKALLKAQLLKLDKTKYAYTERDVYRKTSHPTILSLYETVQDREYLYFILEYAPNNNLRHYIRPPKVFPLDLARFYVAELISGVDYLHNNGIIHRDLKPENILFDEGMHLKICDFGSASIAVASQEDPDSNNENKSASFVGTAQFCSPEMLEGRRTSTANDIWSIGCILYTLLEGTSPFEAATEYMIFKRIVKLSYSIPDHIHEHVRSVLNGILTPVDKRVHMFTLKSYPFFTSIDWDTLHSRTPPPFLLCDNVSTQNDNKNTKGAKKVSKITNRFFNRLLSKSLCKLKMLRD